MNIAITVNGRELTGDELVAWREKNRRSGKLQDRLGSRRSPGCETDTTFLSNFGSLDSQFDGDRRYTEELVKQARQQGGNPQINDVYLPTIAQRPGDPRAFVRSVGEARAYAEETGRGLTVNGREVLQGQEPEIDPFETAPKMDEELVRKELPAALTENPKLSLPEAREMIIEKHGAN